MEETGTIDILEVKERDDGSADVEFVADDKIVQMFIRQGLDVLINTDKKVAEVLPPEGREFSEEAKTWELTDEQAQYLLQTGFIDALRKGLGLENG